MSRLIDADKALEKMYNQRIAHPSAYHLTNYATLILQEAPTVDAVPVIRCKNCKNWNRHICTFDSPNGYCDAHEETTNGYDFCSYGERDLINNKQNEKYDGQQNGGKQWK